MAYYAFINENNFVTSVISGVDENIYQNDNGVTVGGMVILKIKYVNALPTILVVVCIIKPTTIHQAKTKARLFVKTMQALAIITITSATHSFLPSLFLRGH